MDDWILLNGRKVDRAAFEAGYAKAIAHEWEKVLLAAAPSSRCLICGADAGRDGMSVAYASAAGTLCGPCFERFVGPSTPP